MICDLYQQLHPAAHWLATLALPPVRSPQQAPARSPLQLRTRSCPKIVVGSKNADAGEWNLSSYSSPRLPRRRSALPSGGIRCHRGSAIRPPIHPSIHPSFYQHSSRPDDRMTGGPVLLLLLLVLLGADLAGTGQRSGRELVWLAKSKSVAPHARGEARGRGAGAGPGEAEGAARKKAKQGKGREGQGRAGRGGGRERERAKQQQQQRQREDEERRHER
ncbi:hypothetical protein MPTK1_6g15390 [Marchantia polymorpha subsp. ruderalis]|uniref:Uncharacterized protein n=2 Tax=Marchantia polymorpha TaxID=3197 RepID=A0AAF6BSB2_MARPO|nr:hypothetical protein MARPO_0056s0051 [Marchantia polymorpha]BBN14896.1 hypothetical protein Mp_6g15390 [Marchantia polymorpha subsp. ruderalis]|eukprot:PTQ37580.1 hypothetical protein MARPO_0056s0051 [Marchantia polymorpha]